MSEGQTILEDAIEALGFSRQGTIAETANVPDDRWDYRPHPNARSFSEIVRHMIEAAAMLVGEAADPQGDLRRRSPKEHIIAHLGEQPAMSPAELRDLLNTSHDKNVTKVRAAGDAALREPLTRFDGNQWSRLAGVFYAAGHEDYHRGQLAIYARTMGLIPALTQRIHGANAK